MYQEKKLVKKKKNSELTEKEACDAGLEKALDAIKEQAVIYKHAGMTHISSLLA